MSPRLARYLELAETPALLPPGMLTALAACFTWTELSEAIVHLIAEGDRVRGPVQNRLLLLSRRSPDECALQALVPRLLQSATERPRLLRRIGAILSSLLPSLPLPTQTQVVEFWKAEASVDSRTRWLRIASQSDRFFDTQEVYECWAATGDFMALQILVSKAPVEFLSAIFEKVIAYCPDGKLLSRAALRLPQLSKERLARIKRKFPVSFLYVCARTGRPVSEAFAIKTFVESGPDLFTGERPLILWCVGHLGMWEALEKLCRRWPAIREQEADYWEMVESQAQYLGSSQDQS